MGVYIKGMEMPKSCGDCKAFVCYKQWAGDRGDCFCGITKNDAKENEKNADCPLVPVPPHGDLIDRDALEKEAQKRMLMCNKNDNQFQKPYEIMRAIALDPTIIPAEEGE